MKTQLTSTAQAKVVKATQKGKTTIGRQISSFKKPMQRMKTTAGKSTKLKGLFSKIAVPKIRTGKILGNIPAKFSKLKLPGFKLTKLPRVKFPKLPTFKLPKLPKFGLPKLPKIKLPDVPGFFKDKLKDVSGSVLGLAEKVGGAAGDWKQKRDQKKMIFKIVVGIILVFLGMLLWKKK